jgi:outer membrane protein OmpA-like peptidoglycan-associated protein
MGDRLLPAQLTTPATQKIRLADFETGRSELRPEHKTWLEDTVHRLNPQDRFWVYIFGFASKLGPRGGGDDPEAARSFNHQLSYERASAVARFMESMSDHVTPRIQVFSARGSDDYSAPISDNSPAQRAVEVHVYLVEDGEARSSDGGT